MITDEVTSDDPSELSESRIETQSESEVSFADAYFLAQRNIPGNGWWLSDLSESKLILTIFMARFFVFFFNTCSHFVVVRAVTFELNQDSIPALFKCFSLLGNNVVEKINREPADLQLFGVSHS